MQNCCAQWYFHTQHVICVCTCLTDSMVAATIPLRVRMSIQDAVSTVLVSMYSSSAEMPTAHMAVKRQQYQCQEWNNAHCLHVSVKSSRCEGIAPCFALSPRSQCGCIECHLKTSMRHLFHAACTTTQATVCCDSLHKACGAIFICLATSKATATLLLQSAAM